MTARLTGVNDDAGVVVALTQNANETPEAFGKRLAGGLEPAVKALADAKACIENRTAKPDKAIESANKADQDRAEPRACRVSASPLSRATRRLRARGGRSISRLRRRATR